jgi:FkbM family methyltransferase
MLQPGMSVIDVGANVGVYTFSAARRVGETGRVLAVEPFSHCVEYMQETCRINHLPWVTVCRGAASDRDGTARLSLHRASELNKIVAADEITESEKFEDVLCFRLDSLMEREIISQVDLLKIDAEGHELQVLSGSEKILADYRPIILYENISDTETNGHLSVAEFLQQRQYELFRYRPFIQDLIPIQTEEDSQNNLNIIAVHSSKLANFMINSTPDSGEI